MIKVFPRFVKNATPTGPDVYLTGPPLYRHPIKDRQVWVSCTFTEDIGRAESLAEQWRRQGYEVMIGGPAYGDSGSDFVPGRFLKKGYVITSRGCNNHCSFCIVPRREGSLRELPITEGWNVADNNLLQCSKEHIRKVFEMLKRQKQKAVFSGGFDTGEFKAWHVDLLIDLNPEKIFFAYDKPNNMDPPKKAADKSKDIDPLKKAVELLRKGGFKINRKHIYCYVLIGYGSDTLAQAKQRCQDVKDLGVCPFAMLYSENKRQTNSDWLDLQRDWSRPGLIYRKKRR